MAKKKKSLFKCNDCDFTSTTFVALCPKCSGLVEEDENGASSTVMVDKKGNAQTFNVDMNEAKPVYNIKDVNVENIDRVDTGFNQLNKVFGGEKTNIGLMPSSIIVLYGQAGIGKSTLLLQLISKLSQSGVKCGYVSGEETPTQIKDRYNRLGLDGDFDVTEENNVACIEQHYKDTDFIIVDSINTVYKEGAGAMNGTAQLKECSLFFQRFAKDHNKIIFLIAQVTKDDSMAGPNFFKHMVDAVFTFENLGADKIYKIIYPDKNRFGKINDSAIFKMDEKGLNEILDPSNIFLDDNESDKIYGTAVSMFIKGQRPIFAEVQSLVVPTNAEATLNSAVGLDRNKYFQTLAIINKYLDSKTFGMNVYTSLSGGLKLPNEPQLDLAIIASVLSSLKEKNISEYIFIGEVTLNGSIKKHIRESEFLEYCESMNIKRKIICHSKGYTHIRDIMNVL